MAGGQKKVKKRRGTRTEAIWGYLFITPSMLLFVCFFLIPLCICLYAGFTNWNVIEATRDFVGLSNFKTAFQDAKFWKAIGNTFYMLIPIPIYLFLALLFAMACNRDAPGNKVFRVVYYLPYISSIVALVIMWQWLFNAEYGLINNAITALFGVKGPNWLGDPVWIKRTIVIMISWKMIGLTSIYYLAALKNIPKSYYESAQLDGIRPFQSFTKITFPLITPITFYLIVVGLIGSLQTFVEVQLFTTDGGRDYSAGTMVYYVWQKAFAYNEMGYACAVAILFGLFILMITLIQFKVSNSWVYEGE